VHTLVTEKRCFVDMQGIKVATWSRESWDAFKHQCEHEEI
jgi:hypothetical protein